MQVKLAPVIQLLHETSSGVLATQSAQMAGYPFATVLPFVLDEQHQPVFLLSGLAEHTKNLIANNHASLLVAESSAQHVLKGARLTLVGDVQRFDASPEMVARYLRYQPDAKDYFALGDFSFFRLFPKRGRYIAGFGEMRWVEEVDWRNAAILPHSEEENIYRNAVISLPSGVHLLGLDCYGFDVEHAGKRTRHQFPNAPIGQQNLSEVMKRFLASI